MNCLKRFKIIKARNRDIAGDVAGDIVEKEIRVRIKRIIHLLQKI